MQLNTLYVFFFFFFSSRRRHTRCREVSWARRCVQETGGINAEYMGMLLQLLVIIIKINFKKTQARRSQFMSILEKKVENAEEGAKLREYLKKEMGISTRLIRSASIQKRIFVNDEVVKMNRVIKNGEIIKIDLEKDESQNILPEKMDIEIIYEDEDILVVNKKPFMVVHPTKTYQSGTLANGVINYFMESDQNCIVRLVSRLDMNTSGLIIIAKNQFSHGMLSKAMSENKLKKRYLAIVHGLFKEKQGVIDKPIYRPCLLYTSDAADDTPCVDLGGRRIIKKKKKIKKKTQITRKTQ
eukprot:TRINITY_DN16892_c0_g1_i5.p1 TRINITY_DN16892_c0_g1~~TRINITY_DN16892_c0_g1_i5.p1  ORF type:complete len:298 (+),score=87.40 TRINITY_DN16892_c0_g1_i5:91-984(+)